MTEEQHMQKAREVGIDIRVDSKLRWPREASRLWATADAIEDMDELIATALSEAYRSGVEEERERAAKEAEGVVARYFDWQKALSENRDYDAGYYSGRLAAAAAIRKP